MTIENSIHQMIFHLDEAAHQSLGPADAPPLTITYTVPTGGRGRLQYELDPDILEAALELQGPTYLASIFGVSSHTV
jgi:hypothetical protein